MKGSKSPSHRKRKQVGWSYMEKSHQLLRHFHTNKRRRNDGNISVFSNKKGFLDMNKCNTPRWLLKKVADRLKVRTQCWGEMGSTLANREVGGWVYFQPWDEPSLPNKCVWGQQHTVKNVDIENETNTYFQFSELSIHCVLQFFSFCPVLFQSVLCFCQ